MKLNYQVTIGGTSAHITTQNSVQLFNNWNEALNYFYDKCESFGISNYDLTIGDDYAFSSMIGYDYSVSLDKIENL